jgi:hypothetical protein
MTNLRGTAVCLTVVLGCAASAGSARADRTFYLSFDRMERTPLRVTLLPDEAKTPAPIILADSAKLVRGLRGLGVYMDHLVPLLTIPPTIASAQRILRSPPAGGQP